jgi:DNA-binding transcriptional MocR family regulator
MATNDDPHSVTVTRLGHEGRDLRPRLEPPPDDAPVLIAVLASHPDVLVVEDDYAARVADAPYVPVHPAQGRWAVVRSLSKVLGPDLRLALVAGDPLTTTRIEGRQHLSPGWVSHILQQVAALLLAEEGAARLLARAERVYAERRRALVAALAARGIEAAGDSGLGVWVPLAEEAARSASSWFRDGR